MRRRLKTSDHLSRIAEPARGLLNLLDPLPGQQGPHEGPLVTEYTAALVPDAVRFDEVRLGAEQGTVLLIGGETGEAEQRQGLIAGPLGLLHHASDHAPG